MKPNVETDKATTETKKESTEFRKKRLAALSKKKNKK
jgi:hypothetical protein